MSALRDTKANKCAEGNFSQAARNDDANLHINVATLGARRKRRKKQPLVYATVLFYPIYICVLHFIQQGAKPEFLLYEAANRGLNTLKSLFILAKLETT